MKPLTAFRMCSASSSLYLLSTCIVLLRHVLRTASRETYASSKKLPVRRRGPARAASRILEQKFRFKVAETNQPIGLKAPKTTLSGQGAIENNEQLTSADFLDLIVACDDVKQHLGDAHHAEYGV